MNVWELRQYIEMRTPWQALLVAPLIAIIAFIFIKIQDYDDEN